MGNTVPHESYLSSNADENDEKHYGAIFESDYFAEGVSRYVFQGVITGDGQRKGDKCVTKVFKNKFGGRNFDKWVPDLAASKKSKRFAEKFTADCLPKLKHQRQEIEFLIPLIAKMKDAEHFDLLWLISIGHDERYVRAQDYIAIEPFIPGNYTKFNSNCGFEDGVHKLMHAFSHWTWHISGHKFMIVDLQGVSSGNKYILTDPAVHSAERIYGCTDLGMFGMEMVLANHTCNSFCKRLDLSNPLTGVNLGGGRRNTTYSFQLTEEQQLRNERKQSNYFILLPVLFE